MSESSLGEKRPSGLPARAMASLATRGLELAEEMTGRIQALDPEIELKEAERHIDQDRPLQGLETINRIIDSDRLTGPRLSWALTLRAFARTRCGHYKQAVDDYDRILAMNPRSAGAYAERGVLRQIQGDLEPALTDFNQALALDPRLAEAYYNRGLIYEKKGLLSQALRDARAAWRLNPAHRPFEERVRALAVKLGKPTGRTGP